MIKYIKASPDANGFYTDEELDAYVSEQKSKRDSFYKEQRITDDRSSKLARAQAKKQAEEDAALNYRRKLVDEFNSLVSDILPMTKDMFDIISIVGTKPFSKLEWQLYGGISLVNGGKVLEISLRQHGDHGPLAYLYIWQNGEYKIGELFSRANENDINDYFTNTNDIAKAVDRLKKAKKLIPEYLDGLDKALDEYLVDE